MKRKRWVVTIRDLNTGKKSKVHVLAYNINGVRSEALDRHWFVEDIKPVMRLASSKPGKTKGKAQWDVDWLAISEVKKLLKLEWPLKISRNASKQWGGIHRLRDFEESPRHYISVDKRWTPQEASRILWHELCHAMQAERAAALLPADATSFQRGEAWGKALSQSRERKYAERDIEIEAKAYEQCNAYMQLTKEA